MNPDLNNVINDIIKRTENGDLKWTLEGKSDGDGVNMWTRYGKNHDKMILSRSYNEYSTFQKGEEYIGARVSFWMGGIDFKYTVEVKLLYQLWNLAYISACKQLKDKYYGTD